MDEFALLLRNVFPSRVSDSQSIVDEFKKADADGSGTIDFAEFAKMYVDMRDAVVDPLFEEACRMFDFFDADRSGELDPDEFLCLLNQVFPEYCDENEQRAVEQFAEADRDGSGGISFAEFIAYYDMLRRLYDGYEKPEAGPSEEELAAEEARRQAALEAALVACKCGMKFLPDVLPQHQRSCEACKPMKKAVTFVEEEPEADGGPPGVERTRSSVEFAENESNTFVACEWCSRTFFPDRLAVHHRVCKQKLAAEAKAGGGIRPTITDGKMVTVGLYRSMKSGKWTKSGRMMTEARPAGAAKDHKMYHSPQKVTMRRSNPSAACHAPPATVTCVQSLYCAPVFAGGNCERQGGGEEGKGRRGKRKGGGEGDGGKGGGGKGRGKGSVGGELGTQGRAFGDTLQASGTVPLATREGETKGNAL